MSEKNIQPKEYKDGDLWEMPKFVPEDNYWLVGDVPDKIYHSKRNLFLLADDELYVEWLKVHFFPSRIGTVAELDEYLGGLKLPIAPKTYWTIKSSKHK